MKIELIPSSVGETFCGQFCMNALVNDTVSIDAGSVGFLWPLARQKLVRDVFLSHSHIDHIASLPLFLDNVYCPGQSSVSVFAGAETQTSLRRHIFNDEIWPDFVRLSKEESPFLELKTIHDGVPVILERLKVTPIKLEHPIPTFGFVVEDEQCAVAFVSDTRPSEQLKETLNQIRHLRAVFLEVSFPNSHRWLAEKAGHMCTDEFGKMIEQINEDVAVIAFHIKPTFHAAICAEISEFTRSNLSVATTDTVYSF